MRFGIVFALVALLAPILPLRVAASPSGTPDVVPGEFLLTFSSSMTPTQRSTALAAAGTVESVASGTYLVSGDGAATAADHAESLGAAVQPNYRYRADRTPNDPLFPYQWNLQQVSVPQAWDLDTTPPVNGGDPSVVVAVLDTGAAFESFTDPNPATCYNGGAPATCVAAGAVYGKAPDLVSTTFVTGFDFVNNDAHPNDDNGHGTHVTGTIAESTDNGAGVAGIAYRSLVMPVKVLDRNGEGTSATIAQGIDFARTNGATVVNLSLGTPTDDPVVSTAVQAAHAAGITLVAAAGNSNVAQLAYPAAYPTVIAVGAVRYDRTRAFYSNYGANLDLVAPGGDTGVDQNGDGQPDGILQETYSHLNAQMLPLDFTTFGYLFYEGTSMAAPHVAGVAALLRAAGADAAATASTLTATATDLGDPGGDAQYGAGLLNAQAALAAVSAPLGTPSGSITINGGAVATNDPTVTLTLSAQVSGSTVAEMSFSNDGANYSAYQPFATSVTWVVPSALDGVQTVSVKYRSAVATESIAYADSIVLDRTRPTKASKLKLFATSDQAREYSGRHVGSNPTPFAEWAEGSDSGSGVEGTIVTVTATPTAATGTPVFGGATTLTLSGTGKVYVNLATMDHAGNRSVTSSFAVTRAPSRLFVVVSGERPGRIRAVNDALSVVRRVTFTAPAGTVLTGADTQGTGDQHLVVAYPDRDRVELRNTSGALVRAFVGATGASGFTGVASADLTLDGRDEILLGTGDGRLIVLGPSGKRLTTRRPFGEERVGLSVAAGDLVHGGTPEIAVARIRGAPDVRVFTASGKRIKTFRTLAATYQGGLNLAVGDLDGDGRSEIAVVPRGKANPTVRVYGMDGKLRERLNYPDARFAGGLALTVADLDGDGVDEVAVGPFNGRGPLSLLGKDGTSGKVRAFGTTRTASVTLTAVQSFR